MLDIANEFLDECKLRIDVSFQRLNHCLDQLDEKQIWWRPNEEMNSIGILVTHMCGSFRQWTITQINNEEDMRNRPDEFLNDTKVSKAELIRLATKLKSDFLAAIDRLDPSRLTEQRRIQGNDLILIKAIFRALTHLEGHIGQIILLTRMQADNYKIFWTPQTEEQKAERKK